MKLHTFTGSMFFCLSFFCALNTNAQDNVQALADRWSNAYNAFDEEALGNVYTKAAYLYTHGSPMIVGREPIREFWAEDFTIENPKTVLTVTHSVEGYDMILVHGNYEVLDRDTDEILGSGRFAHIWHDVDGEWLLDQDLWNQPFDAY